MVVNQGVLNINHNRPDLCTSTRLAEAFRVVALAEVDPVGTLESTATALGSTCGHAQVVRAAASEAKAIREESLPCSRGSAGLELATSRMTLAAAKHLLLGNDHELKIVHQGVLRVDDYGACFQASPNLAKVLCLATLALVQPRCVLPTTTMCLTREHRLTHGVNKAAAHTNAIREELLPLCICIAGLESGMR